MVFEGHPRCYFQSPDWMPHHAEAGKNALLFPCRGQIPSSPPTNKPPLTQMGLSHPTTTVQLWQESCSNSFPDSATLVTKAQYPKGRGEHRPPLSPKGLQGGTESLQRIYSTPSIGEARFKGLFQSEAGAPGQEENKGRHRHPQPFVSAQRSSPAGKNSSHHTAGSSTQIRMGREIQPPPLARG